MDKSVRFCLRNKKEKPHIFIEIILIFVLQNTKKYITK